MLTYGFGENVHAQSDWNLLKTKPANLLQSTPSSNQSQGAFDCDATKTRKISTKLRRVQNLMRANVLGLAQEVLEIDGPLVQPTMEWINWERQLWTLYRDLGLWTKLYERASMVPRTFPQCIREEAGGQIVDALAELERGAIARIFIRKQLVTDMSVQYERKMRQALISMYVVDGLFHEAKIALKKFSHDYGVLDKEWLLFNAEVLMDVGEIDAAINLLATLQQPAARLLKLYARLLNQMKTPASVIKETLLIRASSSGQALTREIKAVILQAHIEARNPQEFVKVLENYLLTADQQKPDNYRVYPQFSSTDLFTGYISICRQQLRIANLLSSSTAERLEYARQLSPTSMVVRKSFFACLITSETNPVLRTQAVDAYVDTLLDTNSAGLIKHLFGEGKTLGELTLGTTVGYRLYAHAVKKNDIQFAADISAKLSDLPVGIDHTEWLLQTGRIAVLVGDYQRAFDELEKWIESFEKLDVAQTRKILQVVFDLQAVQQHQQALVLLTKINIRISDKQHLREIAYWRAQSYDAIGEYDTAVDLFLQSALQKKNSFDEWGISARFQAAKVLINKKIYADARRIFEDMLAHTTDQALQSRLHQKLQQLWLLQPEPDSKSAIQ